MRKSKRVVLADYRGLERPRSYRIAKKLREAGVEYKVIKNTLTSRAAKDAKIEGLRSTFKRSYRLGF